MARILVIYSTTDGHTLKICSRMGQILEELGNRVETVPVEQVIPGQLQLADKIIVGASIRYGKHSRQIYRLVDVFQHELESRPSAFFSVNVVARKPEKSTPQTNPYLAKFLGQIAWKPQNLAVFAGKIDYQKYTPLDRFMIRMIMWITKGPTDPHANVEFTDWNRVAEFARIIHDL